MAISPAKRQRERNKQERQREKELRRQARRAEAPARPGLPGEDPDIAGIIPGPQPRLEDVVAASEVTRGSPIVAEGTIKRLTDKGFGFIETGTGKDLFFHMSAVEGIQFQDLRQGQRVSFHEGQGPQGPRAETVKVI